MAHADTSTTTHWAVLIGLDFYVGEVKSLQGSVRDVETVRQYLSGGPTRVDITVLSATTPSDPSSRRPAEGKDSWPTRENVINKLRRVRDNSKPGDFVYIHYSGHGTRRRGPSRCAHPSGNLALVLFEDRGPGIGYLHGSELANILLRMVEEELHVTVVLDCCYSGSVLRAGDIHGAQARYIDYDPAIDAESPPEFTAHPFVPSTSSLRSASLQSDQWLVNPDGYTILSACAPHEIAWEIKLGDGERRGALSYFLMEALVALRKSGVELTNHSLYRHLHTRFHASWPQQTPMYYGNGQYSFFGRLITSRGVDYISVSRMQSGRLFLNAGEAHGVHQGDEYVVHPFSTPEGIASESNEKAAFVRVEAVQELTARLVGIEPVSALERIQTGWKAKAMTSLAPQRISIRIMEDARSQRQWDTASNQGYFKLCTEDQDTEASVFNVTVNEHGAYEVLDCTLKRISSLPTIPLDSSSAGADTVDILDILRHITTFKYFEGIENRTPRPSFENSFSLLPSIEADESGVFTVKNGGPWSVTVKNNGTEPLYLALFDFAPSWRVTDLLSGLHQAVVYPEDREGNTGEETLHLTMEVPELVQARGERQCEDIMKLFVTSRRTDFSSSMILPDIPSTAEVQRGEGGGHGDNLSRFLSCLTETLRGEDQAVVGEGWSTRNFIIRTTL